MGLELGLVSFLIVDNNQHTRRLVREMLHNLGADRVRDARSGLDAIESMKAGGAPDILITDLVMSPVDGMELTRFIRRSPDSPNIYMPVIMITGYADRERVFKARDTGVTELLVKPLTAAGLFGRIQAIIEKPRPFVRFGDYFGPDRRRRDAYHAEERRSQELGTIPVHKQIAGTPLPPLPPAPPRPRPQAAPAHPHMPQQRNNLPVPPVLYGGNGADEMSQQEINDFFNP